MSTSSLNEKKELGDEKHNHATVETREVDEAAQLSVQGTVDPAEALRIRYIAYLLSAVSNANVLY